ncbi:unnamed protein product [Phytophthora fragariaefolia]|uniref:Unnamed protein product n=1 Tax=Phytophthora fragariaefolia TaxID=1490495 RepID=A0A9W6Y554_9STRA|nr:unnamed protein product [Phytophthora fragariaefolia]
MAPSAKPIRRIRTSKRKEVCLQLPYVDPDASESAKDTPNPDLVTGDKESGPDTTAPRATKPGGEGTAAVSTSASVTAPAEKSPVPSPKDTSNACKVVDILTASTQNPNDSASAPCLPSSTSIVSTSIVRVVEDPYTTAALLEDAERVQAACSQALDAPDDAGMGGITNGTAPSSSKNMTRAGDMAKPVSRLGRGRSSLTSDDRTSPSTPLICGAVPGATLCQPWRIFCLDG